MSAADRLPFVPQAANALLFMRMVIAHLIERLGSEELQAFAAAPHGFMLEAANEELVAGCISFAVPITASRTQTSCTDEVHPTVRQKWIPFM